MEQITNKNGVAMDQAYMTHMGKGIYEHNALRDFNIQSERAMHICCRSIGGSTSADDIKAGCNNMGPLMQQLQSGVAQ